MSEYDIVELARRIQRIEIVLFHAPLPVFEELDKHINHILMDGYPIESKERADASPCLENISESCEVFTMLDVGPAHDDGDTQKTASTDVDG